jgi:creatinine amidohydrolase
MRLIEMRSDECRFQDREAPIAVLPMGAVEQHSRHLPVGTDMIIAEAVAHGVERGMPDRVLLLPAIAVGASDHHLAMPGTLSTGTRSIADAVARQAVSMHRSSGVRSFLILNGHGGNQPAARLAIEDAHAAEHGLNVYAVDYWSPMFKILDQHGIDRPAGMGHADIIETSILLAHRPDLVALDRMQPDGYDDGLPSSVHTSAGIPDRTRFGGVGDPTGASADQGRQFLDAAVTGVITVIERIAGPSVGLGA